jgi:hypothetical protein
MTARETGAVERCADWLRTNIDRLTALNVNGVADAMVEEVRPQPTPATGEIVERLRAPLHSYGDNMHTLHREAAALIEQQAATIAERDARIEALEKALGAIIRKQDNGTGNAPGHGHSRIGIWDDDPGNAAVGRANLPCEWCETWNEARATLERRGQ